MHTKRLFKGLCMSFGMFSTIPFTGRVWDDEAVPFMVPFLPLVGVVIGSATGIVGKMLGGSHISDTLKAVFMLLFPLLLTGLFHLDGFMDTTDAILSRRGLEEKRRILKDPHPGAFSVIMVLLLFLLQFASWQSLAGYRMLSLPVIWLAPVLSRSVSGFCLLAMPPMPGSSLGLRFKKGAKPASFLFLAGLAITSLVVAYRFGGMQSLIPLCILLIASGSCGLLTSRALGGISGDLCGFALVVGETAALVAAAVGLGGTIWF